MTAKIKADLNTRLVSILKSSRIPYKRKHWVAIKKCVYFLEIVYRIFRSVWASEPPKCTSMYSLSPQYNEG